MVYYLLIPLYKGEVMWLLNDSKEQKIVDAKFKKNA